MKLAVSGVVAVLLLTGCGGGPREGQVAANRAVSPAQSVSASARPGLPDGVTRSPSHATTTGRPDGDSTGGGKPRSGDPTPGSTATVTPVKVTLLRTGGFAGVHDELVVAKDGSWTYDSHDGRTTGRLSSAQTTKLHRLAGDPRLAEEAKMRGDYRNRCPDTFQYRLTAGEVTVYKQGCGEQPDRPVYEAIVDLLAENTPF